MKLWGVISVHFDIIDQLLVRYSVSYVGEKVEVQWDTTSVIYRLQEVPWLKREVLFNVVTEFGIPMKLFTLIKMCLN
jgi:hypothetical protein